MATCEPIMAFLEDITILDKIAQKMTNIDLTLKENRKTLIQFRKEALNKIIKEYSEQQKKEYN